MDSATALLAEIDAFLQRSGVTQTDFGKAVMNNSSFVRQLRTGGGVTLRTLDKVREFIQKCDALKTPDKVREFIRKCEARRDVGRQKRRQRQRRRSSASSSEARRVA
jgi:hypothetical protein